MVYSTSSTPVRELIGKACPDLVFPNSGDYDYVKVELDPVSLKQTYHSLAQISDPLTRQMMWHTLWEMVIDGKIRAQDFANAALTQSKNEKDTLVLSGFLNYLADSSPESNSVIKFLTGEARASYQKKIEAWLKHRLTTAPAGSDQQLIWYQALVNAASQPDTIQFLQNLLNGRQKLSGFTVDQEHRWEIIEALARNGMKNAPELIAQDLKKDQTDMGEKAAIRAEVSMPDVTTKSKWLAQVTLKEGNLPLAKLREAMSNYHQLGQETFTQNALEPYFEVLPSLALSENPQTVEYSKWFSDQMYPSLCEPKVIEKTEALLKNHPEMPATVIKNLKIRKQEEERCIRARTKAQEPETK
jgi:aminopeptidase N